MDSQINSWVQDTGNRIVNISQQFIPYLRADSPARLVCSVLYELNQSEQQEEPSSVDERLRSITVPHVHTTREEGDASSADICMAGIFGVPEGTKLHPSDTEPAPKTLLSPAFDLTPYKAWFVIKESA